MKRYKTTTVRLSSLEDFINAYAAEGYEVVTSFLYYDDIVCVIMGMDVPTTSDTKE